MSSVTVLFFRNGAEVPAFDWLDTLEERARLKCIAAIERLEAEGHAARRPLVENLGEGIWELRVRLGSVNYRLLYFFHDRTLIVLTNGFSKEREVPAAEINRAKEMRSLFLTNPEDHYAEG
jgi:putative component of toxin-antitoxin plasmid stabilization module